MKLNKFSAKNVHGYYNFNFQFNEDLNFLVGINGAGKTSSLRLMQALICFDIQEFKLISFDTAEVLFEDSSTIFAIRAEKNGNTMLYSVNGVECNIEFLNEVGTTVYRDADRLNDYYEDQRVSLLNRTVGLHAALKKITRPVFLGLERNTSRYEDEYSREEDFFKKNSLINRDGQGLMRARMLIRRAYQKYRRLRDVRENSLVKNIAISSFKYVDLDVDNDIYIDSDKIREEYQRLAKRKPEIEGFMSDLGGVDAVERFNTFFGKLETLFMEITINGDGRKQDEVILEWLINKAQINQINKVLAELETQKKYIEKFYEPIRKFINILNVFLNDSRKRVSINAVGILRIDATNNEIGWGNLSSGERQLLILFANASFARVNGGVLIIDEPEVSLHLRWQEMLVEKLLETNNNNQIILATHSPEIVGAFHDKCIFVG